MGFQPVSKFLPSLRTTIPMPKTYKNLYPQIIEFDNLLAAYERARRGKQQTAEMRAFHVGRVANPPLPRIT